MKVVLIWALGSILIYCLYMIGKIVIDNREYNYQKKYIKDLQESFIYFMRKHDNLLSEESCLLDTYFRTNDVKVQFNGFIWTDTEFSGNKKIISHYDEINWFSKNVDEEKSFPTFVYMNQLVWGPVMDSKELRHFLLKLGYYFRELSENHQVEIPAEFEESFKELRYKALAFGEVVAESELVKEGITFIKM